MSVGRLISSLSLVAIAIAILVDPAFAQGDAAATSDGLGILGRGLGMGIAAAGGALGQGKIISAALESIARNPGAAGQLRTPWFLGVVFVETLVIFTFLVAQG